MKLSVCIATFNEEKNIRLSIEAIRSIADEIIIVDGGSKDATVTIAQELGAKVFETTNPPIFHINKQKAIDLSSSEWILQLDADELVSSELLEEIEEKLKIDPQENGFWVPRKNYFLGHFLTKGGQYPDWTIRLYRKGKARLPCKSVHEQAVVEGKVGYLQAPLLHYPYKTFSEYIRKWNIYTNLEAEEYIKKKERMSWFFILQNLFLRPIFTFLNLYLRHKGFVDGFPGFIFALFSGLRHIASAIKYWEISYAHRHKHNST